MQHTIDTAKHGPHAKPMADAVTACVHCGFCLAACPTYKELGQEMDSPRGRIILMKEVLEGTLDATVTHQHLDACLGCLACEPACPSGVSYRDLISPFRALTNKTRKRSILERLRRAIVATTLPHPKRFRLAVTTGRSAKWLKPLLPKSWKPMLDLLPKDPLPPAQSWPGVVPAKGTRRARVALLLGCAQEVLDPDINAATIEVLTRNGVEVVIPRSQGCCGALSWHTGDFDHAREFARKNIEAFPNDVEAIITNAAGCGSGMHEYPLILKGTGHEPAATAFKELVCDVSVFLSRLGSLEPIPDPGKTIRIAYHDACHLSNAQGVVDEPRSLLRLIPGAEIVEIPNGSQCCGSAGSYNLDQPEIAASLGFEKAGNVVAVSPDVVASGNIGCLTQLKTHLGGRERIIPVRHTIQVVRDAYEGLL